MNPPQRLDQHLPMPPNFDGVLTVIGDLVEDVVVWLEPPIITGTDNNATIYRSRGGSGANVAAAASGLVPTRFIGRVGGDPAGHTLAEDLAGLGVDVRVQRAGRTGTVVALVDAAAERTMFPDRAAAAELDTVDVDWLARTGVLHVPAYGLSTPSSLAAIRSAAEYVRRAGAMVTVDASATSLIDAFGVPRFRALIDDLAPEVLFANAEEAAMLRLDDHPPPPGRLYVVKDGPRAAVVIGSDGEVARVDPPHVADVKDTTGAGDAFAAGFLASWMAGRPLADACTAGHIAAEKVLTVPGAGNGASHADHRGSPRSRGMTVAGPNRPPSVRSNHMTAHPLVISDEVATALAENRPVVALESTIFSNLGLPSPANEEAVERCTAAIRNAGGVPAMTAVLDGSWTVGVDDSQIERILSGTDKVAERDLAVAAAKDLDVGVTTVSATVALAHLAGIDVFATGGIGGVHRGSEVTGDVSADLDALASHPVVTVCAGAKAFLDLPKTLEVLETSGVPVLGWQHDWFPAFYTRSSGLPVPHRVETATEVARVLGARVRSETGVLLVAPIPVGDELDADRIDRCLVAALDACEREGIRGAAVTPFVLERLEAETAGDSIAANLALAENNAAVASQVAVAIAQA